jgi:small subunit ribosomal protein S20
MHNKVFRTRARSYVKRARAAIEAEDKQTAVDAVHDAIRELDKAASKGVIHQRNADRRKSRLMKQLAKLEA